MENQILKKLDGAYITNFSKSTKTNSPTGHTGATSLPPIGSAFMYTKTSSTIDGYEKCLLVGKELISFKILK